MAFTLDKVVPWGRSMEEYVSMFSLSSLELDSRILGCADGPASFNAEMHAQGRSVVSVDPVYRFSSKEIRERIDRTFPLILQQLRENAEDYLWTMISSPDTLGQLRMNAMKCFLADFPVGKKAGRYISCELPDLPFEDQTFDLALCSHFLFLYSDQLSTDFHCRAIREMLRVASEVRLFPLLTLGGHPSPHLEKVYQHFHESGFTCEIKPVDYEFQRGANQMLVIKQKS